MPSSHIPVSGIATDGWSKENEATATCFCGAVQLVFVSRPSHPPHLASDHQELHSNCSQPTEGPGLVNTFVCNCTDCRKITASMFASNFTIADSHLKHVRGQDNLKTFGQSESIASGKKMTNYFCSTCGTLMYRVGESFPDQSILRIGTVDDFTLHETKLRPKVELFVKDRVDWFSGVDGALKFETMPKPKI